MRNPSKPTKPTTTPYGMPIRETDEAACVAWLMWQEKVAGLEKRP